MKPLQLILIPVLLGLLLAFQARLRPYPRVRLLFSAAMLAALVFTLILDTSTQLAQWLGVGRGVDLVTYVALLTLSVVCVGLYLRIARLEQQLTTLVRAQALQQAILPESKPD
ncbi:MAG: DUF2304 domain-containing protein [Bacteroidia bacterium]|nr:DUF2304 domain-containing protein [Bacteroidia bacterium]